MALSKIKNTSNLLKDKYPKIFSYLDPNSEKNKKVKLDEITCGSNIPLDFKCTINDTNCDHHIWTMNANKMTKNMTKKRLEEPCPFCNGIKICKCTSLASVYPFILEIWNFEENEKINLDPWKLAPFSNLRANFKCQDHKTCSHVWQAYISNVVKDKSGCAWCSGKRLCPCKTVAGARPDLLPKWDYEANNAKGIFPDEISSLSWDYASWLCLEHTSCNEHKYEASIANVTSRNDGCGWCAHKSGKICKCDAFPNKCPEIFKEFDHENNEGIDPYKLSIGSGIRLNWKGYECGHTWGAILGDRIAKGYGCPSCRKFKLELKINECLDKLKDKYKISYVPQKTFDDCRNIKSGRKLPFDRGVQGFNRQTCIEGDGLQHFCDVYFNGKTSDLKNIQFRDRQKNIYCFKNKIHLLRVSYEELENMESHIIEFFETIREYEADKNHTWPVILGRGKEYEKDSYKWLELP